MTIRIGDKVPSVTFKKFVDGDFADVKSEEFFAGKKILLFGIPGAFTPICQGNHMPGYVEKAAAFKEKGIDEIACISINDTFVMKAFGKASDAEGKIEMLADDHGQFTKGVGLDTDASGFGLGMRSERYAMVIKDGVVEALKVEKNFVDHDVSSADNMLGAL